MLQSIDTRNDEIPYEDFKVICTNAAKVTAESIYKVSLSIAINVRLKNVIWPEWSMASIFVKQDIDIFLPEHKHAMTTIGEDKFKLEQLEKDWRGIISNRINVTLAGILTTAVSDDKRAMEIVSPPYSTVCENIDCEKENGYQNLTLNNPHTINGSTGGIVFTSMIYY